MSIKGRDGFRTKARAFFEASKQAAAKTPEESRALMARGSNIRFAGNTFDLNLTRTAERDLVKAVVSAIGEHRILDDDVTDACWAFADPLVDDDLSVEDAIKFLAERIDDWNEPVRLLIPTDNCALAEGSPELDLGSVRLRHTADINAEPPTKGTLTVGGGTYEIASSDDGKITVAFGMTRCCWDVTLPASPQARRENALWRVDCCISLVRWFPNMQPHHVFLSTGFVEAPLRGPISDSSGVVFIEGTKVSGGGSSLQGFYRLDVSKLNDQQAEHLKSTAELVLDPPADSLAERVGRGLGWLTRGRRALDRGERLLAFSTAIECLLTRGKDEPVAQTIIRHAAVLWSDDLDVRQYLSEELREVYSARSVLVHSGKHAASLRIVKLAEVIADSLLLLVVSESDLRQKHDEFSKQVAAATYGKPWSGRSAQPATA